MALIDKIIWQLERHLDKPLTTHDLATLCAVSPYHMIRACRAAIGQSPMGYLRRRRLTLAAQALAFGADDILTVALDAQYASHEAFTRAFSSQFQSTPRDVRTSQTTQPLQLQEPLFMPSNTFLDLAAPTLRDEPARQIAGFSIPCATDNIADIPALWNRFNAVFDGETFDTTATYGVSYNVTQDGKFDYMAGAILTTKSAPKGMQTVDIPAGRFAIFTHTGHVTDMPKMFQTIWNKGIPDAGLTPRDAPEYEIYDSNFDGKTGRGTFTVAIPVE